MARKGKHKKIKAKNYSKKKFKNIFCSVCRFCSSAPDFCYASIYKSNGPIFISAVYPNLIGAQEFFESSGRPISSISLDAFSDLFCSTGICTGGTPMKAASCPSHEVCYHMFLAQVKGGPAKTEIRKKNKKQKRERKRAVYKPYATYFARNNENFCESIRKILYGDIDNEQDTDKEMPASDTGSIGGQTEDRES